MSFSPEPPSKLTPDYWSFPSAAGAAVGLPYAPFLTHQKQAQLDKAAAESEMLKGKIKEAKGALKAAEKGREDTVGILL